jgi:hypothetical protein
MANYHENAQKFINSAKWKWMTVKAEWAELIAYPKWTPKKVPTLWQQIVSGVKEKLNNVARGIVNNQSAKDAITDAKIKNMKPVSILWSAWEPIYQAAVKTWSFIRWLGKKVSK